MVKKILILSAVFLGLSSMAIFQATQVQTHNAVEGQYGPIVVLELFTSQGCSSCPPADALLEKAKKTYPNNLFALSYHVDYWNYIGWEDPFSNPQFTKKQNEYNVKFKYSSNYTPEMVVNGREHFVGSNAGKLRSKIEEYQKIKSLNEIVISEVNQQERNISFNYKVKGAINDKLVRAILVLDERTTIVKRGENRNRTLKNSNIAVNEKYMVVKADSGSGEIQIPNGIKSNEKLQLVLVMENTDLDITAAAKISL
jgi:hypothetical protein